MGDEFYSIIKLTSGEEIFSLVSVDENDGDPIILLQSPVIIKHIHVNGNSLVKIKPWVELSTDDIFVIRYDKIITMTETSDEKIIQIYNNYLNSDEENYNFMEEGKVKVSETQGYVSSVEEARKTLENIFKLEDTKES